VSFQAMNWASAQTTGNVGRKVVLLLLANYADEHGSCFPGQEKIAEETEQSVRTVRTQLAELERRGFIRRQHRGMAGGGRKSDRYFLNLGNAADFAGKGEPANGASRTGNSEQTNRQRVAEEPLVEPPGLEPSVIDAGASNNDALFDAPTTQPSNGSRPDPVNVEAKKLADWWVELKSGMANFLAVRGVVAKALKAGKAPEELQGAMRRLHEANVPLAAATLETELRGGLGSGRSQHRPYKDADQVWGEEYSPHG
jgi:hypothetical protein